MQVASRLFLIWAVVDPFYAATAPSIFYISMLVAWSSAEVVRYGYFALNLNGGIPGFEKYGVPRWVMLWSTKVCSGPVVSAEWPAA